MRSTQVRPHLTSNSSAEQKSHQEKHRVSALLRPCPTHRPPASPPDAPAIPRPSSPSSDGSGSHASPQVRQTLPPPTISVRSAAPPRSTSGASVFCGPKETRCMTCCWKHEQSRCTAAVAAGDTRPWRRTTRSPARPPKTAPSSEAVVTPVHWSYAGCAGT